MPRRARLRLAGVPVHVFQRGNNRSACFFGARDYVLYLGHLAELAQRFGCRVHAYAMMTNHVHLLLTPDATDSTSLMMKNLGQRHAQYINRTYGRSGSLWEGRFKSCMAQNEVYVLACYRYIELNPVRASMVRHPRDYPWSSYRINAEGANPALIVAHDDYRRLGKSPEARQAAYRALVDMHLDPALIAEIRAATSDNVALGNPRR